MTERKAEEPQDLLGQTLGSYTLEAYLGGGGFAKVYLAIRVDDPDWKVAIKVLRLVGASQEEIADFEARFEREARLCFDHQLPRVIRVLERKPHRLGKRLYQVMEYAPGGSLKDWLEKIRQGQASPIDSETARRIGMEIAQGLQAIHEQNLVHRDIKPANILLTRDQHILVSDLGLAQTAASRLDREELGSLERTPVGDPFYRPPEQDLGQPSDFSADVYMWGATLFELLTLQKYVHTPGRRVREFRPDVPAWLDEVIAIALRANPGERFQTAQAVWDSFNQQRVVSGPQRISFAISEVRTLHLTPEVQVHRPEQLGELTVEVWDTAVDYFWQGRIASWLKDGIDTLEKAHMYPLADEWSGYLQTAKKIIARQETPPGDPIQRGAGWVEFLKAFPGFQPPQPEVSSLDFGEVEPGQTLQASVWVKNSGGGYLEGMVVAGSSHFTVEEHRPFYLPPGAEDVVAGVVFSPSKSLLAEPNQKIAPRLLLKTNAGVIAIPVRYSMEQARQAAAAEAQRQAEEKARLEAEKDQAEQQRLEREAQAKAEAERRARQQAAKQAEEVAQLEKAIESALAGKDWPRARQFIAQLEGRGAPARQTAARYRARIPSIWQRWPRWAWFAAAAAVVTLGIVIFGQLRPEPLPATPTSTSPLAGGTEGGQIEISPLDGMAQVFIPAGPFQMGGDEHGDEKPIHTVYLDAYWMDQTEVTNAQFAEFLNAQGNQEEGGATWLDAGNGDERIVQSGGEWQPESGYGDHPAIEVSWYGARTYCQWAGRRLPTEAEWEKAARGGLEGMQYPWGDQDPSCSPGASNGAQYGSCSGATVAVGTFASNGYGLYDMAGNVWEWVSSLYRSYPYDATDVREDLGASGGRVLRGGSWYNNGYALRVAYRLDFDPSGADLNYGFRCARSP